MCFFQGSLPESVKKTHLKNCPDRKRVRIGFSAMITAGLLVASLAGPADGDDRGTDTLPAPEPVDAGDAAVSRWAFQTRLSGIANSELRAYLKDTLTRVRSGKRIPESLAGVHRRTRGHMKELERALRAEGYYDGKLSYSISEQRTPVEVTIEIDPGPGYTIKQYSIEYHGPGSADPGLPATIEDVGMRAGAPARSGFVLEVEDMVKRRLAGTGHFFATVSDRRVIVDHADDSMSVTLRIAPGAIPRFGPTTIEPPPTVKEDYVAGFITWKQGEILKQSQIDDLRARLLDTGLFDSVDIAWDEEANEDGELPISVTLSERKHRSIGVEAHWSSDVGLGAEVFWEHRNLLGRQEQLTLGARIEEIRQEFDLGFRKPRYRRENQALLADGVWGNQETDAYQGPLTTGYAGLERRLGKRWTVSLGIPVEASNLEDYQGTRDIQLLGLAARGVRDSSDDPLDPASGSRLRIAATPYLGTGDSGQLDFVDVDILGSAYYSLREDRRVILAGRARVGTIAGEDSAALPANRRLYAGGGASIRGYALQSVGPFAPDGTPAGGLSRLELGTELRVKLTSVLGAVVFIEGGNAYEDTIPDLSQSFRWGTGFGFRYFTAVGPFRIDFGFPLDRRSIDDSFQVYVSVGQAF